MKKVVLAASGSGKSYWVDQDPNNRIDYDVLVSQVIGWSNGFNPRESENRLKEFKRIGNIFSTMEITRTIYGMFGEFDAHFTTPTEVAIVIIDPEIHRARLCQRSRWPTGADWDGLVAQQLERLKLLAHKYDIPIFSDFDQVDRFKVIG